MPITDKKINEPSNNKKTSLALTIATIGLCVAIAALIVAFMSINSAGKVTTTTTPGAANSTLETGGPGQ